MNQKFEKGKSKLRPRARIVKTLGEELISDDIVAIVELVKNSYDADATFVEIIFDELKIGKRGQIIIKDNGTGMDLETVKEGWMEPATIIKKTKTESKKGRKILGNKGIGRFAAAKISGKLEMITKKKSSNNEILANFNWEDFNNDDMYLDQIDCSWETRMPAEIVQNGTILILDDLLSEWNIFKLRRLRASLSRLVNPIYPVKDFTIKLVLPEELKELSGAVGPPDALTKPNYTIKGKMDKDGNVIAEYTSKTKKQVQEITKNIKLYKERFPACGSFEFEFRVWDRDIPVLKQLAYETESTLKDIRKDLNEASGINVYRDGFRVLPYGEPKNDWLRLDIRRVQNPTLRISNNQIVGYISITSEKNPNLKDQSNREGLINNQAANDLEETIREILVELEIRRYKERPRKEKRIEKGIFSTLTITPIVEMVHKKLSSDPEAQKIVLDTEKEIKEGVKKIQEVLARYRRLSTLGQLLDTILHEGSSVLFKIDAQSHIIEEKISADNIDKKEAIKHLNLIRYQRKILSDLFRRLEPFSGRKQGKPKNIILENVIKNVYEISKKEISKIKVDIVIPDSENEIYIDESDLNMILLNLMNNTLYWFEKSNTENPKITINIYKEDNYVNMLFSDNGPGIIGENISHIFEPYFTTKPDGVGLGLTIAGELIVENEGSLELIKNNTTKGATFKLSFRCGE